MCASIGSGWVNLHRALGLAQPERLAFTWARQSNLRPTSGPDPILSGSCKRPECPSLCVPPKQRSLHRIVTPYTSYRPRRSASECWQFLRKGLSCRLAGVVYKAIRVRRIPPSMYTQQRGCQCSGHLSLSPILSPKEAAAFAGSCPSDRARVRGDRPRFGGGTDH